MILYQTSPRDNHKLDSREDELFMTIESLRCELLVVAEERSLSDRAVVELSERLDSYIVLAQNRMMESMRKRKAEFIDHSNNSNVQASRNKIVLNQ